MTFLKNKQKKEKEAYSNILKTIPPDIDSTKEELKKPKIKNIDEIIKEEDSKLKSENCNGKALSLF